MKVERIGDAKVVMSNPHGKHKYFAWPTVARLRDGRIAVAASGFRIDHICPFGKAVLSFLNGEGYTAPTPIIEVVFACVVETGKLNTEQNIKDAAAAISAEKPWYFSNFTISMPTDLIIFLPPIAVPAAITKEQTIMSQIGI
jgi:hypothetical protein